MSFTGSGVVKQVSDQVVRITGVSLGAGQSGTIALHGGAGVTELLGAAAPFAVLADVYVNEFTDTVINGDLGYVTPPEEDPTVNGDTHADDATYAAAAAALSSALTTLAALPATFEFAAGDINLSTDVTHGDAGVFTPGVYVVTGAMSIATSPLTLQGQGRYVFRCTGNFTVSESVVCVGGASPNDVYWIPDGTTTVNAGSDFVGNVAVPGGDSVTISQDVTWLGRALGSGSSIETQFDNDPTTITVPEGIGNTLFLPAAFHASPFIYDGDLIALQDSVECTAKDAEAIPSSPPSPIACVKTGTTTADFLITLTNTSEQDSPLLEIMVGFHH
jgi:hypothetical protein